MKDFFFLTNREYGNINLYYTEPNRKDAYKKIVYFPDQFEKMNG